MIPTRILKPPYKKLVDKYHKIFVLTDAGEFTPRVAAELKGINQHTFRARLYYSPDSWRDPRIFDMSFPRHNEYKASSAVTIQKLTRKDVETIKLGTWERRQIINEPELSKSEKKQLAIEREIAQQERDAEYRVYLRQHRISCR